MHRVLDILSASEASYIEAMNNAYSLLGIPVSADRVKPFVVPAEAKLGSGNLIALVDQVAQTVEHRRIKQNITDWPFENFW